MTRNHAEATKSYDPCAGIQFIPPMDTDELFEALKNAFPNGKTHRQRMRQALIEFLVSEAEAEKSSGAPKLSCKSTPFNSVEGLKADVSTVDDELISDNSNERLSRAVAMLRPKVTKPARNSLEGMTIVWPQDESKPRRFRKSMTEDERLQYRQRRALGVCSDCKKQKRKVGETIGYPIDHTLISLSVATQNQTSGKNNQCLLLPVRRLIHRKI